MVLTAQRCQMFTCISTTFINEVAFAYWKPKPIDTIYTIPYTYSHFVWIGTFLSLLLIFTASLLIKYDTEAIFFSSIKVSLLPMINEGLVFTKNKYRDKWSKSILLNVWLLSGALLIMAFQSNLLASLAIVKYGPDMNTLEEVYAAGKKVYLGIDSYTDHYVSNAPEKSLLNSIYKDLILAKGGCFHYTKNRSKNSTFYQEIINNEALMISERTHMKAFYGPMMRMSKDTIFTFYAGWLLSKNLTHKYPNLGGQMNRVLAQLFEGGIPNQLHDYYVHTMGLKHLDQMELESDEPKALHFRHILQLLIVFLICLALSSMGFLYELNTESHNVIQPRMQFNTK